MGRVRSTDLLAERERPECESEEAEADESGGLKGGNCSPSNERIRIFKGKKKKNPELRGREPAAARGGTPKKMRLSIGGAEGTRRKKTVREE